VFIDGVSNQMLHCFPMWVLKYCEHRTRVLQTDIENKKKFS